MPKTSAGLLPFRKRGDVLEVLIAHPGGPLWSRKDAGAWSVVKGEYTDEDPRTAARREFREETGFEPPEDLPVELPAVTQRGGKVVTVFAVEADFDAASAVSNTFEMEWPPKSVSRVSFPEIDRVEWFSVDLARSKLNPVQVVLLDHLAEIVAG